MRAASTPHPAPLRNPPPAPAPELCPLTHALPPAGMSHGLPLSSLAPHLVLLPPRPAQLCQATLGLCAADPGLAAGPGPASPGLPWPWPRAALSPGPSPGCPLPGCTDVGKSHVPLLRSSSDSSRGLGSSGDSPPHPTAAAAPSPRAPLAHPGPSPCHVPSWGSPCEPTSPSAVLTAPSQRGCGGRPAPGTQRPAPTSPLLPLPFTPEGAFPKTLERSLGTHTFTLRPPHRNVRPH